MDSDETFVPAPADSCEVLLNMLGELPGPNGIEMQLDQIQERAEQRAEDEGWSEVSYTEDEVAEREWFKNLSALVQLPKEAEEMTEQERQDRIAGLRPYLREIRIQRGDLPRHS